MTAAPAQPVFSPGGQTIVPQTPVSVPTGGGPAVYKPNVGTNGVVTDPSVLAQSAAAANAGKPGYDVFGSPVTAPPSEPTALSSGTITDTVIPKNNDKLSSLSNKGTYVGSDGLTYHVDGTLAAQPVKDDGSDPQTQQIRDMIQSMQTSLDASTKATVDAISQQYEGLVAAQKDTNTQAEGARQTALLTGGSSRYAPLAAAGIMHSQVSYGLSQIAKLDADENSAIAAAKAAQQSGDMQLMDKFITDAQDIRDNKIKTAQQINDALSKATATALTQQQASNLSGSITSLYSSGVTDPATILKTLQDAGATVTADDVAKTIKDLTPTASSTDVLKYSSAQTSKMLAAGIPATAVQALQDYYNGHGDPASLSGLSSAQQAAVKDAMTGTKAPGAATSKSYTSGSLTYSDTDLGTTASWLKATAGTDGYVDPNAYQQAFDAWTNDGGLPKDFLSKFPPKNFINPTNDWLPKYLQSKTGSAASSRTI